MSSNDDKFTTDKDFEDYKPTELQRRFVNFYTEQGMENATKAMKRAGSMAKDPKVVASQMMKHPWVKWKLAQVKQEGCIAAGLTPEEIIDKLRDTYNQSMEAKNFNAANKAAELLGQMQGVFTKKVETTDTRVNLTIDHKESQDKIKKLVDVLQKPEFPVIAIDENGDVDDNNNNKNVFDNNLLEE